VLGSATLGVCTEKSRHLCSQTEYTTMNPFFKKSIRVSEAALPVRRNEFSLNGVRNASAPAACGASDRLTSIAVLYFPIFRVPEYSEQRVPNWLVSAFFGRTRNREARKSSGASSALNPSRGNALLHFVPTRVLDCRTRRDKNARYLVALDLS
jgi:hypothetical protein